MIPGRDEIFRALLEPLQAWIDPTQKIFLPYLAFGYVLAVVVFFRTRKGGGPRAFFAWCFPRAVFLHRSARLDYLYFAVNFVFFAIALQPFLLAQATVVRLVATRLGPGTFLPAGWPAVVLLTLGSVVVFDFCIYAAHWLQHRVPLLWEFHKVHHSAEVLTPLTVYRTHPVDDILYALVAAILGGVFQAVFFRIFPADVSTLAIAQLNLVTFVFYLAAVNLRHSHIWLSFGPRVERYVLSPAQHQIHHSDRPEHFDKNLGFMLAIWDLLFGTLHVPTGPHEIRGFGLGGEEREFSSLARLYLLPFRKAAGLAVRKRVVPSP